MKYSKPMYWKNDFDHDGLLYFAQRVEEMLFDYSSALYRVPLLNTNCLAEEYCQVYEDIERGIQKEYQLEIVFEEFVHSFKNDIVLKECWGMENITRICNSFGSSSVETKYNTIKYLITLFSNKKYYNWCELTLIKYISITREKKNLEATIRCWLPELISVGYDVNYIYTMLRQFFFSQNMISKDSLHDFLRIFDFKQRPHKVYFSVSNSMIAFKDILQKRLNVKFDDDGMFCKFLIGKNDIIIYFEEICAICPNLAAQIALFRLNLFLRFYKYVGNKKHIKVKEKAMVIESKNDTVSFVNSRTTMFHIPDEIDVQKVAKASEELISGLLLNVEKDFLILSRAIDLHNNALHTSDLDSGFLNLWSSIEVICGNIVSGNKIKSVLSIATPILEKDYLSAIISDILESLKLNMSDADYQWFMSQISERGCENKKAFYAIFLPEYADLREKLYVKLRDYPVLRSRISQLSTLNKIESLKKYVSNYKQRVTWHIYRMYRVRNGIIHSGKSPKYIKHLGEHLHSYADAIINEFASKLSGDIPFSSIMDIVTDIKFLHCNFEEVLSNKGDITKEDINRLIHPEIESEMICESDDLFDNDIICSRQKYR